MRAGLPKEHNHPGSSVEVADRIREGINKDASAGTSPDARIFVYQLKVVSNYRWLLALNALPLALAPGLPGSPLPVATGPAPLL